MKRIFRSILNLTKGTTPSIPPDELIANYKAFVASKVMPEDPSFVTLYHWIEAHQRIHKELPSYELMLDRANKEGNEALIANLKEIQTQLPFWRSDYKEILREKYEQQCKDEFRESLNKTFQIVSSGLKVGKKELKGMPNALEYLAGEVRRFRINTTGVKNQSQIRSAEDSKEVGEQYQNRKKDPLSNIGLMTFLDTIDYSFHGIKPGELFVILAYTSQGKSILSYNLAYNGVVQGMNGMFVPLEMNFGEMRDVFYLMHTANLEWKDHPKFKNMVGKVPLDRFQAGELTEKEEEFFNAARENFEKHEKYGELHIFQPTDQLTPSLLEQEVYDYNAQLMGRGKTLDFLIVDYVGLMVQDKNERYGDFNIDMNGIIKKLKNLAMTFNNGKMLRIITPFQSNRDGYKEAIKNEGVFQLTALSNANEAERSSDGVISLYMSADMKKQGRVKVSCLKNRRGKPFTPFEAIIDWGPMRFLEALQEKQDLIADLSISEGLPMEIQ